ncbi:MAG: lactonase family protein, partial [Anaerolineae bacterium]|nr:lactonase family protein [Anaerolineae bacterium]
MLQTNDPAIPTIEYNVACQGEVNTPPEAVQPSEFYDIPSQMEGMAVSRDGSQVLAGQYNEGILHIYSRNKSTGALSGVSTLSVDNMDQIYGVQYSRDNRHVYYTSQSGDGVVVLTRQSNGDLSNTQVITSGTRYLCPINNQVLGQCPIGTMNGARGIAISPDDKYVYVTGYADGSLTVLRRNTSTGRLSFLQAITRSIGGVNVLGGGVRVTTSPDGDYVYVAAYAEDTLAVFKRNDTGRLNLIAAYKDNTPGFSYLDGPTDVLISPDGNYAYVAARRDNALSVYARSSADGQLTFASVIPDVEGAWGLGMTHDNGGKNPGK